MDDVTQEELELLQKDCGTLYPPTRFTYHLRRAVSGWGKYAYDWADKPHRLLYDACAEIERQAHQPPSAKGRVMSDYSELVERLRRVHRVQTCGANISSIWAKAADAIETLTAEVERLSALLALVQEGEPQHCNDEEEFQMAMYGYRNQP